MTTIDKLIEDSQADDLDQQFVGWPRERWEKLWDANPAMPCHDFIAVVDKEVNDHGTIRRSWLRALANEDPMRLLVGSMF